MRVELLQCSRNPASPVPGGHSCDEQGDTAPAPTHVAALRVSR